MLPNRHLCVQFRSLRHSIYDRKNVWMYVFCGRMARECRFLCLFNKFDRGHRWDLPGMDLLDMLMVLESTLSRGQPGRK